MTNSKRDSLSKFDSDALIWYLSQLMSFWAMYLQKKTISYLGLDRVDPLKYLLDTAVQCHIETNNVERPWTHKQRMNALQSLEDKHRLSPIYWYYGATHRACR